MNITNYMNSINKRNRPLYNNTNDHICFIYFRYLTNISLQVINVPRMKIASTPQTQMKEEFSNRLQCSTIALTSDIPPPPPI